MRPHRRLFAVLLLAIIAAFPACSSLQDAPPIPTIAATRELPSASHLYRNCGEYTGTGNHAQFPGDCDIELCRYQSQCYL